VLCSGTLPRATPFADRVRAAVAAGCAALSLWGRDYASALEEGYNDADLLRMLDDNGLVVAELDPAWWWTPGASEFSLPPELDPLDVFRHTESEIFKVAETLGARSLNAVDVLGGNWSLDEATEAFADLCDRAAEVGLLVHLEWLVWSRIPDFDTAWTIVRTADRPNGGLNVDTWHCVRAGTRAKEISTVPGSRILGIQLNDGPAAAEDNLIEATLHDRQLPGEGEFDLAGYLGALRSTGTTAPLGVEVFSDRLHELGPVEAARKAADATRAVVRSLDAEPGLEPLESRRRST
jgi:sugar phosphate isomerase/epimerase